MRKYGRGRGQAMRRRPSTARLAYLAPAGVVGYLAVAPFAAFAALWSLVPLGVYGAGVGAQAIKIGVGFRRDRVRSVALATGLIVAMHSAYGIGVVQGLVRRPRQRVRDGIATFDPLATEAA